MLWKREVCSCSGRLFAPFQLQRYARCKGGHTPARGQRSYRHGRLSSLQSSLHADKRTARSMGHTPRQTYQYIGLIHQYLCSLSCESGNATSCRCPLQVAAGLHFGKEPSQQHYQGVQAAPPLPLPPLPHKTAWLLIGLQVLPLCGCHEADQSLFPPETPPFAALCVGGYM